MILEIKAIGLVAPVLASVSASALDSGVGHLPTSTWPDQGGTVVLEAHDVTFFANLGQLRPGATVVLEASCRTWTYRVTAGRVVSEGTAIPGQAEASLTMVTCWPTNALYFTHHRYVLSARLVAAEHTGLVAPRPEEFRVPVATLPAGVAAPAVDASTLGIPEGTLTVSKSVEPTLRASAAALATAHGAITVFDTALLAEERNEPQWWAAISHHVNFSAGRPLAATPPEWISSLELAIGGKGIRLTSATLSAAVAEQGIRYHMTAILSPLHGRWLITAWQMRPY